MSTIHIQHVGPPSPPPDVGTVQVHALSAGHLTLPEEQFVHPASKSARSTVPSLSFLIQHEHPITHQKTNIVFDLGLRRDVTRYPESIQKHAATRQPLTTDPDVVKSLAAGGLHPDDVDFIIYSHIHWDHVGEPRDFEKSTFVVGHGALSLLNGRVGALRGGHSFFEADLLPASRTIELSNPSQSISGEPKPVTSGQANFSQPWKSYGELQQTIDIFNDGSVYLVNAPGHLLGHINLLCRTGMAESVYLAGDACHDRRIMRGERAIGEWTDMEGTTCCIHADRRQAEETMERIRRLERMGVEVIFAHDVEWEQNHQNRDRFFAVK